MATKVRGGLRQTEKSRRTGLTPYHAYMVCTACGNWVPYVTASSPTLHQRRHSPNCCLGSAWRPLRCSSVETLKNSTRECQVFRKGSLASLSQSDVCKPLQHSAECDCLAGSGDLRKPVSAYLSRVHTLRHSMAHLSSLSRSAGWPGLAGSVSPVHYHPRWPGRHSSAVGRHASYFVCDRPLRVDAYYPKSKLWHYTTEAGSCHNDAWGPHGQVRAAV